ncbi:MAG: shikimate kinase [Gemmatimonadales bacterium]|nr:MAG: shikimate kinase [Gemmatimonadales bacterium]
MTGESRSGPARGPVVLVGLMAAGKTTVGRILATGCGLSFVDLDHEIERRAGMSVTELFASQGESAFRDLETAASLELAPRSDVVVAVGGGWMANSTARKAWPDARIVWLIVSPAAAALRVGSNPELRPLLEDADMHRVLERLLAQRLPAYAEATYTVDTENSGAGEVAAEIAHLLGLRFST